jgi:hypothetical protein
VWPGNTNDVSVVEEVKRDLVGWQLGRVIMVVDRGCTFEDNLAALAAGEKILESLVARFGATYVAETLTAVLARTRVLSRHREPTDLGEARVGRIIQYITDT